MGLCGIAEIGGKQLPLYPEPPGAENRYQLLKAKQPSV